MTLDYSSDLLVHLTLLPKNLIRAPSNFYVCLLNISCGRTNFSARLVDENYMKLVLQSAGVMAVGGWFIFPVSAAK